MVLVPAGRLSLNQRYMAMTQNVFCDPVLVGQRNLSPESLPIRHPQVATLQCVFERDIMLSMATIAFGRRC